MTLRWSGLFCCLVLAALVLGGCGGTKRTSPTTPDSLARRLISDAIEPEISSDGAKVVFTRFRRGQEFLAEVMAFDYAEERTLRVTDNGWPDGQPTIGADKNFVIFVSEREGRRNVWGYSTKQERYFRVTETGGAEPDLHPSLPVVLYTNLPEERDPPQRDILAQDLKTGQVRTIISGPYDERNPTWSPDGRMIAYASNRAGNDDIYVYDPGNGERYRITTGPTDERFPAWSADMNYIVFSSDLDPYADGSESLAGPRVNLFYVNVRDLRMPSSPRLMFQNTLQGSQSLHAAFHPNGRDILFATNASGLGGWEVVVLDFAQMLEDRAAQVARGESTTP